LAQALPSALPSDPRSRAPLAWEFCTSCWALGEHWAGDCPEPAGARKPPGFDNRRYAIHDFLCGSFRHASQQREGGGAEGAGMHDEKRQPYAGAAEALGGAGAGQGAGEGAGESVS
jgi:hypothetical protein